LFAKILHALNLGNVSILIIALIAKKVLLIHATRNNVQMVGIYALHVFLVVMMMPMKDKHKSIL